MSVVPSESAARPTRLTSLDAFRGAIMLLMASGGLGLAQIAKSFPDSAAWQFLGTQTEHAAWRGCTLWDLIQPAFMFMVGVALPWSVANRRARGEPFGTMFGHALWRAVLLVLLAVFLTSAWGKQTDWMPLAAQHQIHPHPAPDPSPKHLHHLRRNLGAFG